jgi:hypothetical protein
MYALRAWSEVSCEAGRSEARRENYAPRISAVSVVLEAGLQEGQAWRQKLIAWKWVEVTVYAVSLLLWVSVWMVGSRRVEVVNVCVDGMGWDGM